MPNTPSIYFSTLGVENVRCFGGRQVLDLTQDGLPAPWSLIIGENGAGKTTLLECLAWMRPVREGKGDSEGSSPPRSGRLSPILDREQNEILETLPRNGSKEARLNAKLGFDGALGPAGTMDNSGSPGKDFRVSVQLIFDELAALKDRKQRGAQIARLGGAFQDPLMITYGANRSLGEHNEPDFYKSDFSDHDRLSRGTDLGDVENVLMGLDYAAKVDCKSHEARSLELLKRAITSILPDDPNPERIEIHPPDVLETGRHSGVYIRTFTGPVRMSALSLGHRTTAGWVADLASRFIHHYPDSPDPLAEPAVVLIDEIDLHLHPRWQLEIMKDLSSLFRATQFIATSHSPLIVQVAETANLILLRKRESDVEIVNDPGVGRNLRVDQILNSLLFGVQRSRNENTELLFTERAELVDKTDRSQEEENRLQEIRRTIDELPTADDPDDWDAMNLIREFAAQVQQERSAEP